MERLPTHPLQKAGYEPAVLMCLHARQICAVHAVAMGPSEASRSDAHYLRVPWHARGKNHVNVSNINSPVRFQHGCQCLVFVPSCYPPVYHPDAASRVQPLSPVPGFLL